MRSRAWREFCASTTSRKRTGPGSWPRTHHGTASRFIAPTNAANREPARRKIAMKRGSDASLFTARGLRPREFFPHEVTRLRKQYPDTILKLERRGFSPERIAAGRCYQINVYSPRIEDFPVQLFRDRAINWHAQQFGQDGLIAAAGLFVEAGAAYVTLLQSDLCQQIFRSEELKRECASRLNNRFRYWYKLLLNAILDFAADLALDIVY